jgi:hypothetical protein
MHIWSFLGGTFVGSVIGVIAMAFCVVAGWEDKAIERQNFDKNS